jgi:sugar/nucleoside kinase (ribokinase family)
MRGRQRNATRAALAARGGSGQDARMGPDILCIGAVLWDIIGQSPRPMALGADVPGRITRLPGGVAMNIAVTLAGLGLRPAVLTAIGRDAEGEALLAAAEGFGLATGFVHRTDRPTDRYMAIEGANGLIAAIADAHTLEAEGDAILAPLADGRLASAASPWRGPVVLDGNLSPGLLADIATMAAFRAADLRVAPASPGKADRLRPFLAHPSATLYLNRAEAELLTGMASGNAAQAAADVLAAGARRVLVTDGPAAAADACAGAPLLSAAPPKVAQTRVTGAGDTFMAAHIVAERQGLSRPDAFDRALAAAAAFVAGDAPR